MGNYFTLDDGKTRIFFESRDPTQVEVNAFKNILEKAEDDNFIQYLTAVMVDKKTVSVTLANMIFIEFSFNPRTGEINQVEYMRGV